MLTIGEIRLTIIEFRIKSVVPSPTKAKFVVQQFAKILTLIRELTISQMPSYNAILDLFRLIIRKVNDVRETEDEKFFNNITFRN